MRVLIDEVSEFLARLDAVKRNGVGWIARCPAHEDGTPSLSVSEGEDGRLLAHCHAGCSFEDILAAAQVNRRAASNNGHGRVVAEYSYHDETGTHLYDVVRFEPKGFSQRAAAGAWSMKGVRRVPYRLRQLLEAVKADRMVFIVEGEKDVDALIGLGLVATTNVGGAGKWRDAYDRYFASARVVILPDNDGPGADHARDVASHLFPVAKEVRIVELPGIPEKGDVSDWLSQGGTVDELKARVRAVPILTKSPTPATNHTTLEHGGNGGSAAQDAKPVVVRLSDVKPERVSWLVPGILPLGKLGIIEGDPGVNKSVLTLAINAAITTGRSVLGAPPAPPRNVVIVTYEDGLADTIRPRIDALGGDASRVFVFRGVAVGTDDERQPTFPDDCVHLQRIIEEHKAPIVTVDPMGAAIGEATDTHKDASVRRVTARLARLAEDTGACVLGVRHLIKGSAANALRAGGGSIAFVASARVAMLVSLHPDDADKPQHERRRVLACVKNNLAPHPASRIFELYQPDGHEHPSIRWLGESPLSADDLNAAAAFSAPEERNAASDRADWLREVLAGGPMDSREVYKLGRAASHADRSVQRTARTIGVTIRREGQGRDHRTLWSLDSLPPHAGSNAELSPSPVTQTSPATYTMSSGNGASGSIGPDKPRRINNGVREVLRPTQHGDRWFPELA